MELDIQQSPLRQESLDMDFSLMYLQFHCLKGPAKTKVKISIIAGILRDSTTRWTVLWPWLQ